MHSHISLSHTHMGGTSLKGRLSDLITSLQAEGMLNQQFDQLKEYRNEENPQFFMSVLELFCKKTDDDLRDLAKYLSEEPIDYATISVVAHRIKGCCECIGACRVAKICCDLRDCNDDNNKQGCYEAYERLITEYYAFQGKLNKILQLLKSIYQSEARKRQS